MSIVTSDQEEVKELSSLYLTNESVNENSNNDDDLFSEDGQHVRTVELSESINELSRIIDWEELNSAVTSQERSDHRETQKLEGTHLSNVTGELPTSSMFIKSSPLRSQIDRRVQRSASKNGTPTANGSWRERELLEEIYKLKRDLEIERQHSYELELHLRQAEVSERHFEEQHDQLLKKLQSFYSLGDKVEEFSKENAELKARNVSLEKELQEIRITFKAFEKEDASLKENNQELMRQVEALQREKQTLKIELERSFTELASLKDTVNSKEGTIRDFERRENREVVWLRDQMERHKEQIDYLQQCLERMNLNVIYGSSVETSCPNLPQVETSESRVESPNGPNSASDGEDLSSKINSLEESLSNLCMKKDNLEAEYRKLPIAISTSATRRKKGEIEDKLDDVEAHIDSIRLQLRYLRAH
ncbi:hypothetical protein MP638_007184 [Amoeboaphelidium occidentale]|nr:hypothetical protein MP638_007184 [Amoeboaphelidium occidentale]